MDKRTLAMVEQALVPASNGREVAKLSRSTQKALAVVSERLDVKMLLIREAGLALEEIYEQAGWKWLQVEAFHHLLVNLAPEDLEPEDIAILKHLKRSCQLGLVTLSDEAQAEIIRLVTRC